MYKISLSSARVLKRAGLSFQTPFLERLFAVSITHIYINKKFWLLGDGCPCLNKPPESAKAEEKTASLKRGYPHYLPTLLSLLCSRKLSLGFFLFLFPFLLGIHQCEAILDLGSTYWWYSNEVVYMDKSGFGNSYYSFEFIYGKYRPCF